MTHKRRPISKVGALVALQFSRMYGPLRVLLIMTVVLVGLDVTRHGFSPDTTLPWVLGSFVMAPLIPNFVLFKERSDGSLRYVASLPVSEADHGLSRAMSAFLMSLPSAAVAAYALHTEIAELAPLAIALCGVVIALATTAASLCLFALQLSVEMGQGLVRVLYVLPVFVASGYVIDFAREHGWLVPLRNGLSSPTALAALSLGIWAGLGIAAYQATRSIGRRTVRYRGEPAKV